MVDNLLPLRSLQESLFCALFELILPPWALSWEAKPPLPPRSLTDSRRWSGCESLGEEQREARVRVVVVMDGKMRPVLVEMDWSEGGHKGERIQGRDDKGRVVGNSNEIVGKGE